MQLSELEELPCTPFSIAAGGVVWQVVEVLRWLPRARLTAMVEHEDKTCVLKLFSGPRARPHFLRERAGVQAFIAAEVPTPALIAEHDGPEPWLLFERVDEVAEPGADHVRGLSELVGKLHRAGYAHGDLHLGNFLASGERVWAVDGDGVRRAKLDRTRRINELAVLLVQYPVPDAPSEAEALAGYCAGFGEGRVEEELAALRRAVVVARKHRVSRYLQKTVRPCTEFFVARQAGQQLYCRRSDLAWFETCVAELDASFGGDAQVLKPGRSASVVRVDVADRSVIIKRYNVKGFWHRVRRVFKKRGRNAWRNALMLEFLGLPTARAIGLVERGSAIWPAESYLVLEDCGDKHLGDAIASGTDASHLEDLVDLMRWLKVADLSHGDFKATNILLSSGRPVLIDVDAVKRTSSGLAGDARRLLANWPNGAEVREDLLERLAKLLPRAELE